MKVSVKKIMPGSVDYIDKSWSVKENIYEDQGLLSQSHRFFNRTYRNGVDYIGLKYETTQVVGFAIITDDDYLAIFGVEPDKQGQGIGSKIITDALSDHEYMYCHTRIANEKAINFYEEHGFVLRKVEENYYNDGVDAAVLEHKPNKSTD